MLDIVQCVIFTFVLYLIATKTLGQMNGRESPGRTAEDVTFQVVIVTTAANFLSSSLSTLLSGSWCKISSVRWETFPPVKTAVGIALSAETCPRDKSHGAPAYLLVSQAYPYWSDDHASSKAEIDLAVCLPK